MKSTLLEGDLTTPGGGDAVVPTDIRPGIEPILFQAPTISDLIPSAPTSSNKVRVIVETVADPGSIGAVAEGAPKPEAELEFDEVDEPVRKVASFLPVSDELLSDAPAIRAYLNSRLSPFVRQEEENQLLNGTGTGINIEGLLARVPAPSQGVISTAVGANEADHIYAAMVVAAQSYLQADGVVVNPADWADLRLAKDQNGNYLAGSPFSNGPAQPGEALFGKRVVVTEAMAEGTALVGAFASAAQVFRRGGLMVEASNSHEDYFRRDLVAIRAETRFALAVYRPEAFALCDLSAGS